MAGSMFSFLDIPQYSNAICRKYLMWKQDNLEGNNFNSLFSTESVV